MSACSTERPSPKGAFARLEVPTAELAPGVIVITSSPLAVDISSDAPNDRLESAGEGAALAARKVMNTPNLGNGQLETVVGVFGFAAAPFAAAYGAISAKRERLTPSGLSTAENDLKEALHANAGSDFLRQQVAEFARQQTRRLLVCPGLAGEPAQPQSPVGGELEIAVEHLRLKAISSNQYVLWIEARARLLSAPAGKPVLDRHYQYQSGPAMFVDWTRQGGLESVAQTGYRVLGEQIAKEVFEPVSEPPLRLGPRQKRSAASRERLVASIGDMGLVAHTGMGVEWPAARVIPVTFHLQETAALSEGRRIRRFATSRGPQSLNAPRFQFVSLQQEVVTSVEVHAGGASEPLRLLAPEAKPAESPSAESVTEARMDGLENDRNSVVQALSCLAAVPLGLWDQTIGTVRRHAHEKTAQVLKSLEAIPEQEQFEGKLADEVARRLRAQTGDDVRRTDEPLALGSPAARASAGEGRSAPGIAATSRTALEIRVVDAQLQGKHPYSKSRSLCVHIQATLVRTSDGQELYRRPILYRSEARKLKDWAGSDGRLLREELDSCSKIASQALADELVRRRLLMPQTAAPAGYGPPRPVIQ